MQEALKYLTTRIRNRKSYQLQIDNLQRIADLQHPQATDFLIELLNDSQLNPSNKIRILCVLPRTNDARAMDIIWDDAQQDFPPPIPIMELLGEHQEKRAISLLIKALNTKGLYAGERITAAIALGKIGDERAVPSLVNALAEDRTFVGFERVWIPKNIPLSHYALQALKKINTATATRAILTWEAKYDERAQARVEKFIQLINKQQYSRWRHNEDLLRLRHHAIDVIGAIDIRQRKKFKRVMNQMFIGLNKNPEMIPPTAHKKILNFVLAEFERTDDSIFSPSFFDVIATFEDASIDDYAVQTLVDYSEGWEWRQIQLLKLLGKRKVQRAIPIIEEMLVEKRAFTGKPVMLFNALAEIGGAQAKHLIAQHIAQIEVSLKNPFLEAYSNLHRGTDKALHLIDELINHKDRHVQVRAIKTLAKGAVGSFYLLINLLNSNKLQRNAALFALQRLADERALPYLIAQLKDTTLDRELRKTFVEIGTENAYAILNAWDAPDNDLHSSSSQE